MDTYYKECFVESVYHYEALENWQKFQIGDIFQLAYDDTHDIVKVENENFCIGKLSDEDSKSMLPFLKVGWDNLFSAKICLKNGVDSEDKRIKIVIYIASKKE